MNDIPPPKKKKKTIAKAKRSAKASINDIAKQVQKAKDDYHNAQKKLKTKKEAIKKVDGALDNKQNIIVKDDLAIVPPNVKKAVEEREVIFEANEGPQTQFLAASEREVFYGGARGGGKSYAMLIDPLRYCDRQKHRCLLIRRSMPELRDLINHSQQLYPKAYPGAKWREQEKEWRFPSGAKIEFGYAENTTDALRYQGQSYTWIGIDELPQYPNADIYNFLRSSLRSVDPEIPVYMRATGNPGNVGSTWVKEMFVDPAIPNKRFSIDIQTPLGNRSITRRFIPAKLQDNPYLMQTEDYYIMLASLPEVQRKQFLEGDWGAYEDAAFPEFNKGVHVLTPFEIPKNWHRFRACDWGYSSPACVLWFAIDFDNNLYVYRELYTKKVVADQFAYQVLNMENGEYIRYGILDSSTWAKRGDVGPSIAETMINAGCRWRPSDRSPRSRINGKLELHKRLSVRETNNGEKPSLFIFENCLNLIRTLPLLPCDKNNPEDVDTHTEDHAYDALRYGCMSRPINPHGTGYSSFDKGSQFKPADRMFGY